MASDGLHPSARADIPASAQPGRPRLLDLFCGGGGASAGYERAGFEVIGVDHAPQPDYPYPLIEHDALDVLQIIADQGFLPHPDDPLDYFYPTAIHAAPLWFAYARIPRGRHHPDDLTPAFELLEQTGLPYVLEIGSTRLSPLRDRAVLVCGASVGLEVIRHMYFVANWPLMVPPCSHPPGGTVTGELVAFGAHSVSRAKYGRAIPPRRTMREWMAAADLEWMSQKQAGLASPPAYTELIGHQLMQVVRQRCAA